MGAPLDRGVPRERRAASDFTWLHSTTWLDVRAEPWILSAPSTGLPTSARVSDLWSHVIDESTRDEGDVDPLVVAAGGWLGAMPPGSRGIARGESAFVRCELLVELGGPDNPTPDSGGPELMSGRSAERSVRATRSTSGTRHCLVALPTRAAREHGLLATGFVCPLAHGPGSR